jgi:uncharacterized protein YbaP (TraB family)
MKLLPSYGVDAGIRRSAINLGKPIVLMEDPCSVVTALKRASYLYDEDSLLAYMGTIESGTMQSAMQNLELAWKNGDFQSACIAVSNASLVSRADHLAFAELITNRNKIMAANTIAKASAQPVVAALGLAHFCVKQTILDEYRAAGYTVTQNGVVN